MNDTQLQTEDQPTVTGNLYLYETRNYAVIDNTVYEGFNCNGYTFVMKEYTCKSSLNGEVIPKSTVYNTKTCQPLWIARFDDAKNACDNLQVKFDSDVKIAVDNHVAEVDETTDQPSLETPVSFPFLDSDQSSDLCFECALLNFGDRLTDLQAEITRLMNKAADQGNAKANHALCDIGRAIDDFYQSI